MPFVSSTPPLPGQPSNSQFHPLSLLDSTITRVLSLLCLYFSLHLRLAFSRFSLRGISIYIFQNQPTLDGLYTYIYSRSTVDTGLAGSQYSTPCNPVMLSGCLDDSTSISILHCAFPFFFFFDLGTPHFCLLSASRHSFAGEHDRYDCDSTINGPLPPLLSHSSLAPRPTVRLNPTSTTCLSLFLPLLHTPVRYHSLSPTTYKSLLYDLLLYLLPIALISVPGLT